MPNETPATKRAKAEAAELRTSLDEHIKLDLERRKEIKALRKELAAVNCSLKNALKGRDQALSEQETLRGGNYKLQQELETVCADEKRLQRALWLKEEDVNILNRKLMDAESELAHKNRVLAEAEGTFAELRNHNRMLDDECSDLRDQVDSFVTVVTELTRRLKIAEVALSETSSSGESK